MFGKVGLKNTFLFREPECDPVPELMISRQKIGSLVVVFTRCVECRRGPAMRILFVRLFVCDKTKVVPAFLHRMKDDFLP